MSFIFGILMTIGGAVFMFLGNTDVGLIFFGMACFCAVGFDINSTILNALNGKSKKKGAKTMEDMSPKEISDMLKNLNDVMDKLDSH